MHPAEIPELAQQILGYLTENKHRRCAALVCTTWSEIALDHLWHYVDGYDLSLVDLARVFAPVKMDNSGKYVCVLFQPKLFMLC
jgi:hypothetical protein